jgi:poly(A) polymerase
MPIITPAYPSMCATHNITNSTKKVIVRELRRANEITNQIFAGRKQWKDLFERHSFFSEGYKYYLSVIAGSRTKEAQLIWSGLVQSKVRRLVAGIELSDAGVEVAHPFNKGFDRVHRCKDENEENSALQGSLQYQTTEVKTTDESKDIKQAVVAQGDSDNIPMPTGEGLEVNGDGKTTIYTTTYYVGVELMEGEDALIPMYCSVADTAQALSL